MTQQTGRPRRAAGSAGTPDRFAALADGTSRHMLEQLAGGDRAVAELTAGLDELERFWQQRLGALGDYLREACLTAPWITVIS